MSAKSGALDPVARQNMLEIQGPGDPDLYAELIAIFLTSSEKLANKLRIEKDIHKVCEIAHSWKSSAYTVGATHLGDLCNELETLTRKTQSPHFAALAVLILAEFELIKPQMLDIQKAA